MNHQNLFNLDFFPTPEDVLLQMQIDCVNKHVLEPSAGKGNIIDFLKENGAKRVQFCEINKDLQKVCLSKAEMIKEDFLKLQPADISHIELIVMNPPFTTAKQHILHAWEIAPEGCEIITLCNSDTLEHSWGRNQIGTLVKSNGFKTYLGSCFDNAERKTNVNISCVHLFKPVVSESQDFSQFFSDEQDEIFGGQEGIIPHNEIREIVQRYVNSIKLFNEFEVVREKMNDNNKHLNLKPFSVSVNYKDNIVTKESFVVELQKKSWAHVFQKMGIEKFLTSGTKKDLNKFIEQQQSVQFTMRNIYKVIEVVIGTREEQLKKALVEAVDNYTKHTHENRYNVEGWKTNSGYMINKKFIINYMVEHSYYGGMSIREYGLSWDRFSDLIKVLCFLSGKDFDKITSIKYAPCDKNYEGHLTENGGRVSGYSYGNKIVNFNSFKTNTWYKWEFFEFKVFKKGTMHIKFTDLKLWERLNRTYAEIKGQVLPEKF